MVEFRIPRKFKKKIVLGLRNHKRPLVANTNHYRYYDILSKVVTVKTCLKCSYIEACDWMKFNYPDNVFIQKIFKNVD